MRFQHRTQQLIGSGLLGAGLLLTGCDKLKALAGKPPAAPAAAAMAPEVAVFTVQPERVVLTTELAGRISAHLVAEVRPQVGGIIQERKFTEGSDVKAGDVLYQIDPATYAAALASATAAVGRAEANLIPLRLKAGRYGELVKIKAVSQQDNDDVLAALKLAEADREVAKAAADIARINLDHTQVTAPIAGRIGKSSVTTGALVTANQAAPLAVIQDLDSVYVDVTQASVKLLQLQRNLAGGTLTRDDGAQTSVKLFLEDGTPYPQPGVLKFSDVTVDPSTGSVTVRTLFPNPDHTLLPGMYVRVVVEEGVVEQALLVPQQGVTRDPRGNATAMVVSAEGKAEMRVLQTERSIGDRWLVRSGLAAGDRVIMEGTMRIRQPGTPVRAVPFGAKPEPAAAPAGKPQG